MGKSLQSFLTAISSPSFSADLHLVKKLIFFFSALFRLEPSCVGLQAGVEEAVGGLFPERCGERRVSQIETLGSHGHIYRAPCMLHSCSCLFLYVCLYVNLCVCFYSLHVVSVPPPPFFLLFTFSQSHPPPLSASNCLSLPYSSIVSLYLAPLAASALEDEIVMLIVIFCGGDKEGESHMQEIAFRSYGGSAAGYGKHPLLWLHSNSNYTEDSHMDGSPKRISCMMILRSS